MATIIYIAGYYMSMSLSWSWICALLGSFSLLIITGPLYWCVCVWALFVGSVYVARMSEPRKSGCAARPVLPGHNLWAAILVCVSGRGLPVLCVARMLSGCAVAIPLLAQLKPAPSTGVCAWLHNGWWCRVAKPKCAMRFNAVCPFNVACLDFVERRDDLTGVNANCALISRLDC